eukprot:TRINITY_DN24472_c0_g1_i1.p1 TRINITY_DN24472_c0_g1~~TRINITY_DN24472_c0_g1_i1.p1  ORF type:complete len:105 (-),score=5.55 TRINITY_DN24472_c0_g1_i1:35-349(-)
MCTDTKETEDADVSYPSSHESQSGPGAKHQCNNMYFISLFLSLSLSLSVALFLSLCCRLSLSLSLSLSGGDISAYHDLPATRLLKKGHVGSELSVGAKMHPESL